MGLSATFLALGTRQIIASVVPVPDAETAPLMIAFHQLLATGEPVTPALAQAQWQLGNGDPLALAAAAGFVSIGTCGAPELCQVAVTWSLAGPLVFVGARRGRVGA